MDHHWETLIYNICLNTNLDFNYTKGAIVILKVNPETKDTQR